MVLYEGPASIPGTIGANWIDNVTMSHTVNASLTIRTCRYDRPGYGFSDNAATAAFDHIAAALEEALDKAGEFARVSKPKGGFILVGEGYGGFVMRLQRLNDLLNPMQKFAVASVCEQECGPCPLDPTAGSTNDTNLFLTAETKHPEGSHLLL